MPRDRDRNPACGAPDDYRTDRQRGPGHRLPDREADRHAGPVPAVAERAHQRLQPEEQPRPGARPRRARGAVGRGLADEAPAGAREIRLRQPRAEVPAPLLQHAVRVAASSRRSRPPSCASCCCAARRRRANCARTRQGWRRCTTSPKWRPHSRTWRPGRTGRSSHASHASPGGANRATCTCSAARRRRMPGTVSSRHSDRRLWAPQVSASGSRHSRPPLPSLREELEALKAGR